MKRVLILTAIAVLTIGASGCRCCDWLFRGAAVGRAQAPMCYEHAPQCDPCVPCDPCGSAGSYGTYGTFGGGATAPMIVTPGPENYSPAPIR